MCKARGRAKGNKQKEKLELLDRSEYTLNSRDATMYRALAARCNYLAQDRPDLETCGLLRLVYTYMFQDMPTTADIFPDT